MCDRASRLMRPETADSRSAEEIQTGPRSYGAAMASAVARTFNPTVLTQPSTGLGARAVAPSGPGTKSSVQRHTSPSLGCRPDSQGFGDAVVLVGAEGMSD